MPTPPDNAKKVAEIVKAVTHAVQSQMEVLGLSEYHQSANHHGAESKTFEECCCASCAPSVNHNTTTPRGVRRRAFVVHKRWPAPRSPGRDDEGRHFGEEAEHILSSPASSSGASTSSWWTPTSTTPSSSASSTSPSSRSSATFDDELGTVYTPDHQRFDIVPHTDQRPWMLVAGSGGRGQSSTPHTLYIPVQPQKERPAEEVSVPVKKMLDSKFAFATDEYEEGLAQTMPMRWLVTTYHHHEAADDGTTKGARRVTERTHTHATGTQVLARLKRVARFARVLRGVARALARLTRARARRRPRVVSPSPPTIEHEEEVKGPADLPSSPPRSVSSTDALRQSSPPLQPPPRKAARGDKRPPCACFFNLHASHSPADQAVRLVVLLHALRCAWAVVNVVLTKLTKVLGTRRWRADGGGCGEAKQRPSMVRKARQLCRLLTSALQARYAQTSHKITSPSKNHKKSNQVKVDDVLRELQGYVSTLFGESVASFGDLVRTYQRLTRECECPHTHNHLDLIASLANKPLTSLKPPIVRRVVRQNMVPQWVQDHDAESAAARGHLWCSSALRKTTSTTTASTPPTTTTTTLLPLHEFLNSEKQKAGSAR